MVVVVEMVGGLRVGVNKCIVNLAQEITFCDVSNLIAVKKDSLGFVDSEKHLVQMFFWTHLCSNLFVSAFLRHTVCLSTSINSMTFVW